MTIFALIIWLLLIRLFFQQEPEEGVPLVTTVPDEADPIVVDVVPVVTAVPAHEEDPVTTDEAEAVPVATDVTEAVPFATDVAEAVPVATDVAEAVPVAIDVAEADPSATDVVADPVSTDVTEAVSTNVAEAVSADVVADPINTDVAAPRIVSFNGTSYYAHSLENWNIDNNSYSRNPERFYFIVLVDSQEILYIDTEEVLPIHREKHVFSSDVLRGKMSNFQGKKFLRYYLKLRNGEETCFQDFVDTLDLPKKGSIYIF